MSARTWTSAATPACRRADVQTGSHSCSAVLTMGRSCPVAPALCSPACRAPISTRRADRAVAGAYALHARLQRCARASTRMHASSCAQAGLGGQIPSPDVLGRCMAAGSRAHGGHGAAEAHCACRSTNGSVRTAATGTIWARSRRSCWARCDGARAHTRRRTCAARSASRRAPHVPRLASRRAAYHARACVSQMRESSSSFSYPLSRCVCPPTGIWERRTARRCMP